WRRDRLHPPIGGPVNRAKVDEPQCGGTQAHLCLGGKRPHESEVVSGRCGGQDLANEVGGEKQGRRVAVTPTFDALPPWQPRSDPVEARGISPANEMAELVSKRED